MPPLESIELSNLPPASISAFFMFDVQPAAQLSSMIAADNQRFYLGKSDAPFPDELFPDKADSNTDEEFEKWSSQ